MSDHSSNGVTGGVHRLLRFEALLLLTAAVLAYAHLGLSWVFFAALFLAPDLSFAAYLFGARAGAIGYNAMHTTVGPIVLALASQLSPLHDGIASPRMLLSIALIWFAHIGFDRALGYGLKYATGFGDTHLSATAKAHEQFA